MTSPYFVMVTGLLATFALGGLAAIETAMTRVGVSRVRRTLEVQRRLGGSPERHEEPLQMAEQAAVLPTLVVCRVLMLLLAGGCLFLFAAQQVDSLRQGLVLGSGIFLLLYTEMVARQWAVTRSQEVAQATYPLGVLLSRLLYPGIALLQTCSRLLVRSSDPHLNPLGASLEEIHEDLRQLHLQGLLEQDESQIIQSVFQFGDTIAKEVMVPRVDMVCVELGSPTSKVLELMIQSGFTRLPVYDEDVDNIQGLVHAKDLLRKMESIEVQEFRRTPIGISDLREVVVVPGTKKIAKILRELQTSKITMAIVVDEYGGTDGLLTLEDIVEEIVGEITDEYDQQSEGVQINRDGSSIVDAKMVLEDVNDLLKLDLPVDEHETLGGYVYGLFGRVPKAGESMVVDGMKLTVEATHRQRITRVRIRQYAEGSMPSEEIRVPSGV